MGSGLNDLGKSIGGGAKSYADDVSDIYNSDAIQKNQKYGKNPKIKIGGDNSSKTIKGLKQLKIETKTKKKKGNNTLSTVNSNGLSS